MVQKVYFSITAIVSTSTNLTTQASEYSSTRLYYTEASCGREDILASLLGASVISNLGLIGIIIVITICKFIYFKVNLAIKFSKIFCRFY